MRRVRELKIGPGTDPEAETGPLVTRQHLDKGRSYVDHGVKEGAKLVVDGRGLRLQGYENGFFLGGCLFDEVTPEMRIYREEIDGASNELVRAADRITVGLVPSVTDDVRTLITELDQILSAEYAPEQQRHGLALDAIFKPDIRFFLAHLNGVAVGCGGVALFADFAEVKRMYVRDVARGRGVARALLARIERETHDAGLALLRLETGVRQTAALRFYQLAGFQICAAFGAYATMAPHAIATSVFLQKHLGGAAS